MGTIHTGTIGHVTNHYSVNTTLTGVWIAVHGAKRGDNPEVRVQYSFFEDRPYIDNSEYDSLAVTAEKVVQKRTTSSAPSAVAASAEASEGKPSGSAAAPSTSSAAAAASNAPGPQQQQQQQQPGPSEPQGPAAEFSFSSRPAGHPEPAVASAGPRSAATAAVANVYATPRRAGRGSAADGPYRRFAMSVDLRSFQASSRLPLNIAAVYVQAVLPVEIIGKPSPHASCRPHRPCFFFCVEALQHCMHSVSPYPD